MLKKAHCLNFFLRRDIPQNQSAFWDLIQLVNQKAGCRMMIKIECEKECTFCLVERGIGMASISPVRFGLDRGGNQIQI